MGRHAKEVLNREGFDRRKSGYYSTPPFVAEYIAKRCIEIAGSDGVVLDPCVGAGEMVLPFLTNGSQQVVGIDVLDLPRPSTIQFHQADFLDLFRGKIESTSDYLASLVPAVIVANPPYNCHETDYIRKERGWLSRLFSDVGIHNMYSMFIAAMVDTAPEGCVIGIVTLDSLLTSKAHYRLRQHIRRDCTIHEVLLCPTDLFKVQGADVRTCILILQKGTKFQQKVRVLNRLSQTSEFKTTLMDSAIGDHCELEKILWNDVKDRGEICIGIPDDIKKLFDGPRVGDSFSCITGVSTGNDAKYLSRHRVDGFTVPFFKNPGKQKYFAQPNAYLIDNFIEETQLSPTFKVRNQGRISQAGICCSSMGVDFSACYKPQGTVCGVNTNIVVDEQQTWWLLAYLNSNLARYMIRGVLARSNMVTSGYIARLPLPPFNQSVMQVLDKIGREAYERAKRNESMDDLQMQINNYLYLHLAFAEDTRKAINRFCSDIVRLT